MFLKKDTIILSQLNFKRRIRMKSVVKFFDDLPLILKVIFALPALDILWAIYRLCRSIDKGNAVGIILAIIMLIVCPVLFWIIDIITLLINGKVLWID